MKIYVDGVNVATRLAGGRRPNVAPLASARVSIGALDDGFNLGQNFDGIIDEVRLSDVALSPSQFLGGAVPEPSSCLTFAGLALCFGISGWWRRRRR